jgi:poly(3-hydroxybutyrate) depolymerase
VLIVAPLSGHYASLLRGTVEAFLQDHDVYISDWVNARDVPMLEGRFDFHDYIDHVRFMLRALGPRPHVVAVCQPGPPVLAAASLMAEDNEASRPASMTFMGSPIDARLSPTVTNKLAEERPFTWFQKQMIYTVPPPYPGALRRVYPGFVQLYSFMSMNMERHQDAHLQYFNDLVKGDGDGADKHLEFYNEYLSVLDLTEEFYLQTIDIVFQTYQLPKGELSHRGRLVRPDQVTDIGLMTVEGEDDDISGIGQTQAAHGLCSGLPEHLKIDYVQPSVGHYGVFNGRRFREEIYPRVREFIARCDAHAAMPVEA